MKKRIIINTMLIVLIVVLLCGTLILGLFYNYFNDEMTDEMYNDIKYIARGVELEGEEYLKDFDDVETRVTWVAADGTVLYDNEADVATMDNHADREEIKAAMISSSGNSVRYSSTMSEKHTYHAIRLTDGSVIRLSYTQSSVWVLLLSIIQPMILVLLVAFVISVGLAYRLSGQLVAPLDKIDLDHPEEATVYDEMAPFVRKIIVQNQEIKENMDQLKAQRDEFNLITKNMQEGLVVIDKHAKILSHNSSALELFDINFSVDDKNVLVLNRTEEFAKAVDMALSGKHDEMVMPVGERYYNIYFDPVVTDEMLAGAIIIVTDVTEKEQRENLRREFSANVSHELKTPLTSISGYAEIIKDGIADAKDVPEFAGKIYDEAKRLINLVEDIIKVSQLDEGNLGIEKEELDLYDIAKQVVASLEPVAVAEDITLRLEGTSAKIRGIKAVVEEMIFNLCDNAIKYNKKNGYVQVTVGYANTKDSYITVRDTGIGIPKDQQERIFERFYRVDKSHSKEIGGTGLGLSIVKHGASLHGAKIEVESDINAGTEITVTF